MDSLKSNKGNIALVILVGLMVTICTLAVYTYLSDMEYTQTTAKIGIQQELDVESLREIQIQMIMNKLSNFKADIFFTLVGTNFIVANSPDIAFPDWYDNMTDISSELERYAFYNTKLKNVTVNTRLLTPDEGHTKLTDLTLDGGFWIDPVSGDKPNDTLITPISDFVFESDITWRGGKIKYLINISNIQIFRFPMSTTEAIGQCEAVLITRDASATVVSR